VCCAILQGPRADIQSLTLLDLYVPKVSSKVLAPAHRQGSQRVVSLLSRRQEGKRVEGVCAVVLSSRQGLLGPSRADTDQARTTGNMSQVSPASRAIVTCSTGK
jgi:hypothetical protein